MVKLPKSEVDYEHPSKGDEYCRGCKHFEVLATKHCERVQGIILPGDWCDKYLPMNAVTRAKRAVEA